MNLLTLQDALLDDELDLATAERMLGPIRETSGGLTLSCDVEGTVFSRAKLEMTATGLIAGVLMELREPLLTKWGLLLDIMGRAPREELLLIDNPHGPLSFILTPRRGTRPGIVIVEIDPRLSTLTSGDLGERVPIVAAVRGSIVRRKDLW